MTGFEARGVELQMDCHTVAQAVRTFEYSCTVCCAKGLHIRCDGCAISVTHEQVCAAMNDEAECRRQNQINVIKAQKSASKVKSMGMNQ